MATNRGGTYGLSVEGWGLEEPHHGVGVFPVNPPSAEAAKFWQTPPTRRAVFPERPQSQGEGDAAAGASGRGDSAHRLSW